MVSIIRNRKISLLKLCSICIGIIMFVSVTYYIIVSYKSLNTSEYDQFIKGDYKNPDMKWNNHPRGVIVTLTRSSNQSIVRVINMIHSVVIFHPTTDTFRYPFVIFHDQYFTSFMREHILSCVHNHNKTLKIKFVLFNFQTNIQLPDKFKKRKDIGYHLMCRFWSYDVFYHPAIVKQDYDYLMRMDADSYFLDKTIDLFKYMDRNKMDYIYRSIYSDDNEALFKIEKVFLNRSSPRTNCVYNNFFMIRLQWFYKTQRIQRFVHELIRDDSMLREYISDGCVHSAMIDMDGQARIKQLNDIPYGHNHHIMLAHSEGAFYNYVKEYYEVMMNSCDQLLIINNKKNEIKRIKI